MPTLLRSGDLRERITFLSASRVNNHGFATVSWNTAFTVHAAMRLNGGVNDLTQDRRGAKLSADFVMRYRSDVTGDMRVTWRTQTFEITALLPEPAAGWLTVGCLEETAP